MFRWAWLDVRKNQRSRIDEDLVNKRLFVVCFIDMYYRYVLGRLHAACTRARIGILHTVLHVTVACNTPIRRTVQEKFFIQNGVPTYRVHQISLARHPDKLSCDHGRELDQGIEGNTRSRRG